MSALLRQFFAGKSAKGPIKWNGPPVDGPSGVPPIATPKPTLPKTRPTPGVAPFWRAPVNR